MEDEEFNKLPLEERCVHKLWKARVNGYEEVTKIFRQMEDEKSPEFAKYLGLVKKFVMDSNAIAQEKGLEATLAYVERYAHAGKTAQDVMSGIVAKCIAAPKTKTKELAVQVTLMYIEIEKQEAVQDELLKGTELKNPKIVSACVNASTTALREFGTKIISIKPLLKKIGPLLSDRDKGVRDETKLMIVEVYRWIGAALRPQLQAANLQPVQMTELEGEFSKVEGQKATPLRYVRSQQSKQAQLTAVITSQSDDVENDELDVPQEIDPFELADPVEILSKVPKDFYEKIEAKKWQERKEALEAVEALLKTPKLENGDYGDLVRALRKVVQKDTNIVCVALAGKCLAGLTNGLKKKFQQYSSFCIPVLLEKFKEKKQNVVSALREAIDAIYLTTTIEAILEDVLEALNNKSPSVKIETQLFLSRAFTKTLPTAVNKKTLKAITSALIKNINESDPSVRETSAESLGTLMKLVGEKAIGPLLVELEKDNLKMSKIKEYFEKANITVRLPVKKERPTTTPAPKIASVPVCKPVPKRSAPLKKKTEISSGSATVTRSKGKPASQNIEKELSNEEVDEIITRVFDTTVISDIVSANWKARLAAAEQILTELKAMESSNVPTQAIVKFLSKKPGLKDTNFQVLKAKLEIIKYLAESCTFTITTANCCIADICEKFSDSKSNTAIANTLTAISEATSLGEITDMVLDFSFNQKSPKVQQESLIWLSGAMKAFGFNNLNVKFLIDISKRALASTNPTVRQSAITLLGVMYLYMGASIYVFFETEKASLRDMIAVECEKYKEEMAPAPTKGVRRSASSEGLDVAGVEAPEPINIQDLIPHVDISSQITEFLLNELTDKNWKVRNEALTKIMQIIQEAKSIKPNLGDLPQALATRLTDSNIKIAQTALNVCEVIARAMGAPCKQYIKDFFPGFLQGLGDSKVVMRTTSMDTINVFAEQCGYKDFFENEMVGDALKTGSPPLRIELWSWLARVLPKVPLKSIPKEELLVCIPHLYSHLEDRNADVRKNAQEAILGFMIHLGYESMVKQCEKLKPSSKTGVLAALEKVRPNLPVKATVKKQTLEKEDKAVRGTKSVATSRNAAKSKGVVTSKSSTTLSNRKKDDDLDTSPLLVVNNTKQQRSLDETKLKVLKWNFTQPREEFVELLRDQMTSANVNKTLMMNMFHSDFKHHIKAIESLYEDLSDNKHALISNLDLILKWLTLRFFDTNPSVLLKGLEYLHAVFNMLIDEKYRMSDNEASSFVPYLVLKIGDPKDSVRNGVKGLLHQINRLHPVGKMFSYVMEGIKSKNARQRAECLEVMGSIIEESGIGVCVPTPAACLKEVAKQISDRDNSVRNAALNCILQAYNLLGDKVYKFVGNISDKDMSLLEERIKRSSRRNVIPKADMTLNATVIMLPTQPQREASLPKPATFTSPPIPEEPQYDQDYDVQVDNFPSFTLPQQIPEESQQEINGPFKLDEDFIRELEMSMPKPLVWPQLKVTESDLEFLKEPIYVPTMDEAREQVKMKGKVPWAFPVIDAKNRLHLNSLKLTSPSKSDLTIERLIKQMAASNTSLAIGAMLQLEEILPGPRGNLLSGYEDDFMVSITTQLKYLAVQDPMTDACVAKCYKNILAVVDSFYQNKLLGSHLSIAVIKDLMDQFISLLVEEKLVNIPSGEAYIRVINLHCVQIIERSEHTYPICAHIQLLNECIGNGSSARKIDLVMKCLWRIIKLMPTWGDEIDYDLVLLEVHNFMKKFPSSWWKSKEVDTPLRTIKTILHSSAKLKGGTIVLHLGKIPNTSESEVESYILRVLKGLKITDIRQLPSKPSLSRANHSTLTGIFQKIGIKEEAKNGLNLLYDFTQEHPETDIEPFLKNANKFFQDYIKNGLKEIEESRRGAKQSSIMEDVPNHGTEEPETFVIPPDPRKPVEYYRQRLEMWCNLFDQVKAGKKVTIPKVERSES